MIPGMPSRVDHLLRHTAGLALGSSLKASLGARSSRSTG